MAKKYKKLTKLQRKRLRKQLKPNSNAENFFMVNFNKKLKRLLRKKIKSWDNLADAEEVLKNMDMNWVDSMSKRLGEKLLAKNRKSFNNILNALTEGLEQQVKKEKEERLFKLKVNSLAKEKKLYKPFLEKFENNMKIIKKLPEDVYESLKKAYSAGEGLRASEVEQFIIEKMGKRAKLIVRTESSKINSALTEVRAKSFNIKCYIWSSSLDQRVRSSHLLMDGVLVFWNDPPSLDKMIGHAGEFPNCRCISAPVFELDDITFPVKVAEKLVITSKYDKRTKKQISRIVSGKIKVYNKQEFLAKYEI